VDKVVILRGFTQATKEVALTPKFTHTPSPTDFRKYPITSSDLPAVLRGGYFGSTLSGEYLQAWEISNYGTFRQKSETPLAAVLREIFVASLVQLIHRLILPRSPSYFYQ